MLAMGLGFQVPIAILAAVKLGVTTPKKLRKNRRYAYLVIVVLAAFLPTIDPVTLILETIPLLLLYEGSILLSAALVKPAAPTTELAGAETS
jgi:sec-independent protein translocase protein TatC